MILLENWRRDPRRVPGYRPSWGDLLAASMLDELEQATNRPLHQHQHFNIIRR